MTAPSLKQILETQGDSPIVKYALTLLEQGRNPELVAKELLVSIFSHSTMGVNRAFGSLGADMEQVRYELKPIDLSNLRTYVTLEKHESGEKK